MIDVNKLTNVELKKYLVEKYGLNTETVNNIKNKACLLNLLSSLEKVKDIPSLGFDINLNSQSDKPRITDPDWTDFILNQLSSDEKEDNIPKTDGLRRLVETEISQIIQIDNEVVQAPSAKNGFVATVKTKIFLANGQIYTASADAFKEGCQAPYNFHLTAVAETRAEGRCYRKILRLKNLVTKEEIGNIDSFRYEEKLNDTQKNFIKTLASPDRLNININKLLEYLFPDNHKSCIHNCSYNDGVKIIKTLSEFQSKPIPEDLKGYSSDWEN